MDILRGRILLTRGPYLFKAMSIRSTVSPLVPRLTVLTVLTVTADPYGDPGIPALAMRYLEPVAEYDEAGAVTDPDTGLTFGYLRYTEVQSNRIFVTVECLYGYKQAIADGIKRIVKP